MSESESTPNGRSRRARIAVPFAVGAMAGATVIGGVALVAQGGGSDDGIGAIAAATRATSIASTAASLSAEQIYRQDSPGVVDISVTTGAGAQNGVSPFGPGGGGARAEGTGFVYDKAGNIVTASHVVEGATAIQVRFTDGSVAKATLVGTDPSSDTAVIKVSVPSSRLKPLALADSSGVRPGQGAVAIGSPFGYEESITAGIVSAVDRSIEAPNGYSIPNAIQTDAPINHGNSGGPLIDASGKVIGVNVQIAADDSAGTSQNAGVGFAVPSNTVKRVADDLVAGRTVQHAYLGVSIGTNANGTGAVVGTVRTGSPAAGAGVKSGDVVVSVNGKPISSANELTAAIGALQPGDKATLKVQRGGSSLTLTVTLATRPATAPTA
jgi:putative serine protease PepD